MRKLKRDVVVSIAGGRQLVGVYWDDTNGRKAIFESSPAVADAVISAWNSYGERLMQVAKAVGWTRGCSFRGRGRKEET